MMQSEIVYSLPLAFFCNLLYKNTVLNALPKITAYSIVQIEEDYHEKATLRYQPCYGCTWSHRLRQLARWRQAEAVEHFCFAEPLSSNLVLNKDSMAVHH